MTEDEILTRIKRRADEVYELARNCNSLLGRYIEDYKREKKELEKMRDRLTELSVEVEDLVGRAFESRNKKKEE